jgi:hypothetical protein
VKQSAWLGIGVGTMIASPALWFGLFAIQSSRVTGLAIIFGGIIFAIYAMAAFSGVADAGTVAFHSSLYAIVTASILVMIFSATGSPSYVVAAPVLALGVGGAVGTPPVGNRLRTLSRSAAVILVTIAVVAVYWVDHTVYAMVAPLLPLPAVGIADRIFVAGEKVMAEPND